MADNYVPKFQHSDWRDNVDLVAAEGEEGFNKKFHDLRKELDEIARIMKEINNSLDQLKRRIDSYHPSNITLTFAPTFFPVTGKDPWKAINGSAANSDPAVTGDPLSNCAGWLPLQLPHGLQLNQVTIFYQSSAPGLNIKFLANSLNGERRSLSDKVLPPTEMTVKSELLPLRIGEIINNHSYSYCIEASAEVGLIIIKSVQIVLGPALQVADEIRDVVARGEGVIGVGGTSRTIEDALGRLDLSEGIVRS